MVTQADAISRPEGEATQPAAPLLPDRKIGYLKDGDIWVVDRHGHKKRITHVGSPRITDFLGSPTGKYIAYSLVPAGEGRGMSLRLTDLTGATPVSRRVMGVPGYERVYAGAWLTDERLLFYDGVGMVVGNYYYYDTVEKAYHLHPEPGEASRLSRRRDPGLSPDGSRVAFFGDDNISIRGVTDDSVTVIYRGELGGGRYRKLKWSPDGRHISVSAKPAFILPIGDPSRVHPRSKSGFHWLSETIVTSSREGDLIAYHLDTRTETVLDKNVSKLQAIKQVKPAEQARLQQQAGGYPTGGE